MTGARGNWRARVGRGRGRGRGSASSSNSSRPERAQSRSRPCRFFTGPGTCRFGSTCKYSHEESDGSRVHQEGNRQDATAFEDEDRTEYNGWRRFLWRSPFPQQKDNVPILRDIWSGALEILNGDGRESQQMLARDLVDDGTNKFGCQYLHLTLKVRVATYGGLELDLVEDFLHAITHAAILDSLSIDTYIGTLYNVISGTGGERAVAFFLAFCQSLIAMRDRDSILYSPERLDRCLGAMLEAMYQLLCREKRASFHEDLPVLFNRVESLFGVLDATGAPPGLVYISRRSRLDVLRKIVNLSKGLMSSQLSGGDGHSTPNPHTVVASVYPIEMPLPGGHHDNDHMNIARINIIPTPAEISSNHPDYLPSTDCRQPHFHDDPVLRYFDTHFRLLRHDIFGPLKTVLSRVMLAFKDGKPPSRLPSGDLNAHLYQNASITHISMVERRGFEVQIGFSLPHHLHGKSADERRRWWETSKRLEPGGLVCLLSSVEGNVVPLLLIVGEKRTEDSRGQNLVSNSHMGAIAVKLARLQLGDLQLLTQVYHKKGQGVLVALPGLIPATFTPILQNLQEMIAVGDLAFQECIVPDPSTTTGRAANPSPPRYARRPGFSFPLDSITSGEGKPLLVTSESSPDDPLLLDMLEVRTALDRGQSRALVCALTRQYALIQGPPGTGKSFLGVKLIQVLLASKGAADLGPIIIICYTNHALDQFLEHLLAVGIRKIIRIGSQSRSPELEGLNLKIVRERTGRTKHEGFILGSTYSEHEKQLKSAGHRLGTLHKMRKGFPWAQMKRFIQWRHPEIHAQLFDNEMDGYTVVGKDPLEVWLRSKNGDHKVASQSRPGKPNADELAANAKRDVKSLLLSERQALVEHWLEEIRGDETEQLFAGIKRSEELRDQINSVHNEVNRRALLTADVIGITTTGLARDIATLQKLRAKIVVCEEAAEVLEAHVISALMPGVEHIIQIGDHQQLRPQINNFALSLETPRGMLYQLDRSQFERLATGEPGLPTMPIAQLSIQRRMRPDIVSLIRNTMYPDLQDDITVSSLPDVVGMRENVFWLDHNNMEDTSNDEGRLKSHSNEWEVDMTKALVRHLVRQGAYKSTDIAVLTPYSGQLQKLRAALSGDFDICLSDRDEEALAKDDVDLGDADDEEQGQLQKRRLIESLRLATVDNFQGEEAKIIIVSLVRGNKERKAGFLRTKNRINVLLSRAQHGMYLIGNADTYAKIPMWADVHRQLDAAGAVGQAFNLACPRHQDTPIQCAEPDDFLRNSPEGGCLLPCDRRLDKCGHRCQAKCHSEAMHAIFFCPQPCPRVRLTCSHQCPKLCGEKCGLCHVLLDQVELSCGHKQDGVACFKTLTPGDIQCAVEVNKNVPGCGHTVSMSCFHDVTSTGFLCPNPCKKILDCGHTCPGTCGTCEGPARDGGGKGGHQTCRKPCGKPRNTCSHICRRRCHASEPCSPCESPCEVRCGHSRCSLKCPEPCAPCIERCAWSCEHQGRCSMPCAAPCNRLPCDERCSKTLSCGHRCPGLCGEPCPEKYCQDCGSRVSDRVDLLEFKSYKDINLDESPIVVLGCGHFFTTESLDGVVRLHDVYSVDATGQFTGLLEPSALLPVPCCPDCKRPIRQFATQRYNRIVNAAVLDETSKRFLLKGRSELEALEQRIEAAEDKLQEPREETVSEERRAPLFDASSWRNQKAKRQLSDRYKELKQLERQANKFCEAMNAEQQPSKKLFDAILEAKSREPLDSRLAGLALDDAKQPAADKRMMLGGRLARLRIQATIFTDKFRLLSKTEGDEASQPGQLPDKSAKALLKDCEAFVKESSADSLPRLSILGALLYTNVATCVRSSHQGRVDDSQVAAACIAMAQSLLESAEHMCNSPFNGAEQLRNEVETAQRLLGREWYDPVTAEERAAIKVAMVSGAGGIATHSGHWYKCRNRHTFAIGECGMPMELARCPECGVQIGGENHQMVEGMHRATEME